MLVSRHIHRPVLSVDPAYHDGWDQYTDLTIESKYAGNTTYRLQLHLSAQDSDQITSNVPYYVKGLSSYENVSVANLADSAFRLDIPLSCCGVQDSSGDYHIRLYGFKELNLINPYRYGIKSIWSNARQLSSVNGIAERSSSVASQTCISSDIELRHVKNVRGADQWYVAMLGNSGRPKSAHKISLPEVSSIAVFNARAEAGAELHFPKLCTVGAFGLHVPEAIVHADKISKISAVGVCAAGLNASSGKVLISSDCELARSALAVAGRHADAQYQVEISSTSLPERAFYYASVEFPNLTGVTANQCRSVGASCFYQCAGLETVHLPVCDSVEDGAFWGCSAISQIELGPVPSSQLLPNNLLSCAYDNGADDNYLLMQFNDTSLAQFMQSTQNRLPLGYKPSSGFAAFSSDGWSVYSTGQILVEGQPEVYVEAESSSNKIFNPVLRRDGNYISAAMCATNSNDDSGLLASKMKLITSVSATVALTCTHSDGYIDWGITFPCCSAFGFGSLAYHSVSNMSCISEVYLGTAQTLLNYAFCDAAQAIFLKSSGRDNVINRIGECAFARAQNRPDRFSFFNPNGMEKIWPKALCSCYGQHEFHFDAPVGDLASNAFLSCYGLETVYIEGEEPGDGWDSLPGWPFGLSATNKSATVFDYGSGRRRYAYPQIGYSKTGYVARINLPYDSVVSVKSYGPIYTDYGSGYYVFWGDGLSTHYNDGDTPVHKYAKPAAADLSVTFAGKTYYSSRYRRQTLIGMTYQAGAAVTPYSTMSKEPYWVFVGGASDGSQVSTEVLQTNPYL